jgi:hypothetical protein
MLGHDTKIEEQGWAAVRPTPGAALRKPEPLFKKLETTASGEDAAGR